MMRICYLNHDLKEDTGAGRFGLSFIAGISAACPAVRPVVLTVEDCGHPLEAPVLHSDMLKMIFRIPRIRSFFKKCDIIHALDGFPYGVIAAVASLGLGKRLVITAVGTGAIQPLQNPVKRLLLGWAYRRADRVIAVSNYTKREISLRAKGLDISVISHAVDSREFDGSNHDELIEEERAVIQRMKPYMLSVGGGKKRKGYEYSFLAFAEVIKQFPRLNYVVVGHDIKNTPAESLGVADKTFCFFGIRRPFLRALYRNAELFMLLPYDDRGDVEGFGLAFLEAAAAGLPIVGTYGNGAEDAVENGENSILVEPRNSGAAAAAAVKILLDPRLKEKFSKGSVDFAKRMSWDKVAKEYIEIYKAVLKSKIKHQNAK
ncbi:MAG: glycosyltransferase [Candidatus Sungbacteria bacterium]|nr:glycosyltransferase [Candidatus Sungbacteria bacterium]